MNPVVSLITALIAELPQEVSAISAAYNTVKEAISAPDQATIEGLLTTENAKTDADVAQLDADAVQHGAAAS